MSWLSECPKQAYLSKSHFNKKDDKADLNVFLFFGKSESKKKSLTESNSLVIFDVVESVSSFHNDLPYSDYGIARNKMGQLWKLILSKNAKSVEINFVGAKEGQIKGVFSGLEVASYSFKVQVGVTKRDKIKFSFKRDKGSISKKTIDGALSTGVSMNLSRHLINLPPNLLNPKTYSEFVKLLFAGNKKVKVDVWTKDKLKKENMNLLLAVGSGADESPCLIHIKYRPNQTSQPIALVGKGITFDSGGLDLKPPNGMRLMKKDMGGSAAVLGAAYWASLTHSKQALDVYLSVAENAVDEDSFRPSDVIEARNGKFVEIDNTDAEGRLVLADALDVAVNKTKKDKPKFVIDVATLTGSMNHSVGTHLYGFFSNDKALTNKVIKAGADASEPLWHMPLVKEYYPFLKSDVSDISNCCSQPGGAITAALFLEQFIGSAKWAHFDTYSWINSPRGPFTETGGYAQSLETLINIIR